MYEPEDPIKAQRLIEIARAADTDCELFLQQESSMDTRCKQVELKLLQRRASLANSNVTSFCINQRKRHPI
ncbi:hypothetical protein QN375_16895 [Pseudomonas sp. MH9.2]|uniref:hypothetical protein n=1 Tax=unclassified Pseudomonas TaxID=196821 RepID=UPI002AC8AAB9|nr:MULTISPECIES: hypothetical protein [unclassified Pseudomonas]MEB0008814.1 hypothetical protein [Pseudomonas sp. RTB2]MEB0019619.1 hypothetical protein [Pseudomonas sp. RTB3]MEB0027433.1 hypothetical protein [Pseudomonas sp. MH9.2]MEB0148668.1 hypothetical protein [Pseudomonas sp. CCC2.2]MEB0271925.1 hypothetical protein [Pseudomonas sp. 5B4]